MRSPPLFILVLLVSFASICGVLFTPGLPAVSEFFKVKEDIAQLTMTSFLLGYAVGQLPYGPLSDRFGRIFSLRLGTGTLILGSLFAALSAPLQSFWLLILSRLIMGMGSSVGMKIAYTIVGDVYKEEKARKISSYFILSFAIGPALAYVLGGFLVQEVNWQSCFYALTLYGILIYVLSYFLPETHVGGKVSLRHVMESFFWESKNCHLLLCSVLLGLEACFVYLFATESPFISMEVIGIEPYQFGLLNLIPPLGMIIGSFLSASLASKTRIAKVMNIGLFFQCVGILAMFGAFFFNFVNIWTLFLPIAFIYIGMSLIFANISILAVLGAKNKSHAAAIMGFLNQAIVFVAVLFLSIITLDAAIILPSLFLGVLLLSFLFWQRLKTTRVD